MLPILPGVYGVERNVYAAVRYRIRTTHSTDAGWFGDCVSRGRCLVGGSDGMAMVFGASAILIYGF